MDRQAYWDRIYDTKAATAVSWYKPSPQVSMSLIRGRVPADGRVIDVGGGTSNLVEALLQAGYREPIVLDVSNSAVKNTMKRLGPHAALVHWIVADVTQAPTLPPVDLWHDRAVLHFLTDPADQQAYARLASRTIVPGGHAVIATFAPDGPERCSGLPVQRHDAVDVVRLLGHEFELVEELREMHVTPAGAQQSFQWTVCRRC